MDSLNQNLVDLVRREVDRQDIHFSHLADEMVDHISCEIEYLLIQGSTFQDAYSKVMGIIGPDGLQELQKETLYMIDKKYRFMKNSMKITGVAGMALLAFGALFKIQHFPGGDILFVAGFFLLGALFFPVSILVLQKESKQLERPLIYVSALIGGLALIFAIMLKVMHWPGANPLCFLGYAMLGLLFLPLLLFRQLKNTMDKHLWYIYILGAVSLFFCLAGTCFKFNHFPGAYILLLAGSLGFTALFFPLYALKEFKGFHKVEPRFIFMCIGIVYFNLFNLLLAYN
jgi:hypothetical protein